MQRTTYQLRNAVAAVLAGVAVIAGAPGAARSAEANAPAETGQFQSAPSIRVVSASQRQLVQKLSINGSVLPREEAAVGTDLNGLVVLEIFADEGDRVKKGAVLARLDRTNLETQLVQAKASWAQADAAVAQANSQILDFEIAVRQAQETMERAQSLYERKVGSETQADNAGYAYQSAVAKLETAKKAKASAEAQLGVVEAKVRDVTEWLEKTEVKAPANGIILSRSADLGSVVSMAAGPLFRIAINSEFELVANVAEAELPSIEPGMPVSVRLPGLAAPLDGKVRMIAPEINPQTRLGKVHVTLPDNANVRPGNFAGGEVELARRSGIAVPQSALVYRDGEAFLHVVEDGVVKSRPVITGIRDNGNIEIAEGIAPGELVVERAGTFVGDGDRITPVPSEQAGVN